ncbi:hypothetical protein J6590_019200 [Homalodisca vitripennis]|nr:hypothetical protein J6590_019200 [Homalodisca vitripennis]
MPMITCGFKAKVEFMKPNYRWGGALYANTCHERLGAHRFVLAFRSSLASGCTPHFSVLIFGPMSPRFVMVWSHYNMNSYSRTTPRQIGVRWSGHTLLFHHRPGEVVTRLSWREVSSLELEQELANISGMSSPLPLPLFGSLLTLPKHCNYHFSKGIVFESSHLTKEQGNPPDYCLNRLHCQSHSWREGATS